MTNLAVIAAANPEMEALAIAVACARRANLANRRHGDTGSRAGAAGEAALGRSNLAFDDSGGEALTETPAGISARLAAETASKRLEPPTLLACSSIRCCGWATRKARSKARLKRWNWRCCAGPVRKPEATD